MYKTKKPRLIWDILGNLRKNLAISVEPQVNSSIAIAVLAKIRPIYWGDIVIVLLQEITDNKPIVHTNSVLDSFKKSS